MISSPLDDADALPEPPADIATRKLPLVPRPAGMRYVRIHRATDGAVWFGWNAATQQFRPSSNRFDAPDRSYGVLYMAATRDGSFAESIGRKPGTFRSNDELAALAVTTLALTREVVLVSAWGCSGRGSGRHRGCRCRATKPGAPLGKGTPRPPRSTGRYRISVSA